MDDDETIKQESFEQGFVLKLVKTSNKYPYCIELYNAKNERHWHSLLIKELDDAERVFSETVPNVIDQVIHNNAFVDAKLDRWRSRGFTITRVAGNGDVTPFLVEKQGYTFKMTYRGLVSDDYFAGMEKYWDEIISIVNEVIKDFGTHVFFDDLYRIIKQKHKYIKDAYFDAMISTSHDILESKSVEVETMLD
jgi:hypothetical protein